MKNSDMITLIYVTIDDIIKTIDLDPKPGPKGSLNESEILTLMIIHPLLKPFCDLKRFYNWICWIGDKGNRGKAIHKRLWNEKQIAIKITGGKERQWIENVFGFLKEKLGLNKIRVRITESFLARVFSILCAYNLIQKLVLTI